MGDLKQINKDIEFLETSIENINDRDTLRKILMDVRSRYLDVKEIANITEESLKSNIGFLMSNEGAFDEWIDSNKVQRAYETVIDSLKSLKKQEEERIENERLKAEEERQQIISTTAEKMKKIHKIHVTVFVIIAVLLLITAGVFLVIALVNMDDEQLNRINIILSIAFAVAGLPIGLLTWLIDKFYVKDDDYFIKKATNKNQ